MFAGCGMRNRNVSKYIQCDECLRTTPAYKDKNEAAEQWADQWEIVQGSDCMLNKN